MAKAIRELLDAWFDHLPTDAMADLKARFQKRDSIQHRSAFFELYWHELLLRCGYKVEIHPNLDGVTTNPDFLASKNNIPRFFLEATLALPPSDLAADRRLAEFHDTLDRVNSPDYFLALEYRGIPAGNLSGRQLRGQLEKWLEGLNFEQICKLYEDRDFDSVPTFLYEEKGLLATLTPMPKGPVNRGRPGVRTIGTTAPAEARFVNTHDDIKASLNGKANKYGAPSLPLVVAVNVMSDFHDDIDLRNALFGEEQITVCLTPDGKVHHDYNSRKRNGVWFGPQGPRNQCVSAVLTANHLLPWTLRSSPIDLFHNPWASHSLPPDAFPIPQRYVSLIDGKINRTDGILAADLLDIPAPWPVPDP